MSIITLTDRISVSVRAKNNTQSNSQKRDTGRNIAKALGNGNISDDLADQLGVTAKPTIADENGNEWVSMEDIIAAGRKMKENGAFGEELDKYEGANYEFYTCTYVKYYYNGNGRGSIHTGNMIAYLNSSIPEPKIILVPIDPNGSVAYYRYDNNNNEETFVDNRNTGSAYNDPTSNNRTQTPIFNFSKSSTEGACRQALALGVSPSEHHGGSIIDWDAPNAEVERQIKELHETWDVSEHPGASGQGVGAGTYILAGPIEFNDGD